MAKKSTRKITLESNDKLTVFFKEHQNDKVCEELENHFNVTIKINAVGMLVLRGDKESTAKLEECFTKLKSSKKPIVLEDIYNVIEGKLEVVSEEDYAKKSWTQLDFRDKRGMTYSVKPKTPHQKELIQQIIDKKVIFAGGSAGAGKTFIACAVALKFLEQKLIKKIVVTRPHVAAEEFGFLPGDIDEKMAPFLYPIFSIFEEIIGREKRDEYITKGIIEILPVAFSRGVTLGGHDGVITIIDECENLTIKQAYLMLTRLGNHINSKIIFAGDELQTDLRKGGNIISTLKKILQESPYVGFIDFDSSDIVRSAIVQDIVGRFEKYNKENEDDNSDAKQNKRNQTRTPTQSEVKSRL